MHLERKGEAAPLAQIRLRYGGNDALTEALDSALGRARFEYDPAGRLVQASGEARETFEYDPAGNLTRQGRQEYAYNAGNERVSTPEFACRHDGDGNLVEEDTPQGLRRYAYNALGLLAGAEMPGGVRAEYAYDPFGRRHFKRVHQPGRGGRWTETRFVWAGDQLLSETVTDEAGNTIETRDFLFLPGSFTPLAQRVNGSVFCCHTDFRGAPTRLTDDAGQVAWAAAYSAYGEARPRKERLRQPLRLPGQYHDAETGLHQNRWRCFDPQTGRYLSPDPLGLLGGTNLYAYAEQDPLNSQDPLGLFPGLGDLVGHLLPPQAMQAARQLRQTVTQNVLHHLGPLRSLLPPANPRPPDPAMSLVHPQRHLPPLPAQAPVHHQAAAHRAPAPARCAARCASAPHSAAPRSAAPVHHSHHAPVPLPPQPKTPYMIFTAHDTAEGLKTGVRRTGDFLQGFQDQIVDTFNPVNIYKGAHQFGQDEADIYIPSADGTTKDGDAYARKMGREALDGFNPLNKKTAYGTGKTATNIATVILPGAEELNALRGLKAVARAADGDVVATSAAAERAAGTPGAASAEEALRAAKARQAAAHEAYQAKLPGAGARKMAAKARAAGAKAKERRAGGAEPSVRPLAPRTPEQVAAAEQKFNSQKQGALEEARHHQLNQRRPALAGGHSAGVARPSEAPGGPSTAAIGQPGGKSGVMKMAKGEAGDNPSLTERIKRNRNLKTRSKVAPVVSVKKDYHTFDLAQRAKEFRKKTGYYGTSNVAVIEYDGLRDSGGKLPTIAVKSIPQGDPSGLPQMHSEPIGLLELEKAGVPLDKVARVYTERAPCMSPRNYCATLLASELPNVPVYHSFEFGTTEESMAAGNAELEKELRILKKQSPSEGLK